MAEDLNIPDIHPHFAGNVEMAQLEILAGILQTARYDVEPSITTRPHPLGGSWGREGFHGRMVLHCRASYIEVEDLSFYQAKEFCMKIDQVAVPLYTLRNHLKTPAYMAKTLKRVREIGHRSVSSQLVEG